MVQFRGIATVSVDLVLGRLKEILDEGRAAVACATDGGKGISGHGGIEVDDSLTLRSSHFFRITAGVSG